MWALLLFGLATATSSTSTVASIAPILRPPHGIPAVPFTVDADRLFAEEGVYVAEGHAVLRRAGAIVYADRIRFDEARGIAIAEGNVTAVEQNAVLSCTRVEMKVPELIGGLESGELRIKAALPEAILSRLSARQLRSYGEDQMILTAEHMERTSPKTFDVESGSFTVCDCGEDSTPSWKIKASSASVDLDSGAWMFWPVFYAKGVPIFALPVFYFPLGDRRTGLLTPRPGYGPITGFRIEQPFYLVLGDSFDATVEAGYFSDRGPTSGLELRWAPSEQSNGSLHGSLIFDLGKLQDDGQYDKKSELFPRWSLAMRHRTQFESSTSLAVDLNLIGDPAYLEFADEYLARQVEGSRSRITIASFFEQNLRVAGGLQLFQDLRGQTYSQADVDPAEVVDARRISLFSGDLFGRLDRGPGSVRYRFAELRLDATPYPLVEGTPFLAEAVARVHAFGAPRPEIGRFLRVDLRPQVSLPLSILGLLFFEPSVALRVTAWTGRADSDNVDANRAAFVAQATLHTTFWRDYGSVVHLVRPELAYLLIPKVWGGELPEPLFANDEIDQLASAMQIRARLVNDFVRPNGVRLGGLEIWFGRDLRVPWEDEPGLGNSEVVVRGDAPLTPSDWPLRVSGNGRFAIDPRDGLVTDVAGGLSMAMKYVTLAALYEYFGTRPPAYPFIAPEELVPAGTLELPLDPWTRLQGLIGSIRLKPIEPLTLGFDISFTFDDDATSVVRDTRSSISWISPCDCWSASLTVTTARDRSGFPGFVFGLDLTRLGGGL